MGGRRDYGEYSAYWLPDERKFKIFPRYRNRTTQAEFGLGNAKITINVSNPPTELTLPITGETTADKLLPNSPFEWREWNVKMTGMVEESKDITGFNGWTATITYNRALGHSIKEATDVDIVQHGWGAVKIPAGRRLEMQGGIIGFTEPGIALMPNGLSMSGCSIASLTDDDGIYGIIVVLREDGTLSSYRLSASSDTGFVQTDFEESFSSEAEQFVNDDDKIVEIAGSGRVFKARYASGIAITAKLDYGFNIQSVTHKKNIGRITAENEFSFNPADSHYYITDDGLAPILDDDILSVFADGAKETIVRLDDALNDFDFDSIEDECTNKKIMPSTLTKIESVAFDSDGSVSCNGFCQAHKDYIDRNRIEWRLSWAGVGGTGSVVEVGDDKMCKVPVGTSSVGGGTITIKNDDGVLMHNNDTIEVVTVSGVGLIEYLYNNDMSNVVVVGGEIGTFSPAKISSYFFTYADGRMQDIDLS